MIKVHHTHIFQFAMISSPLQNNVIRSSPLNNIVDKIDLSVTETKLNHYK